jgi:hypothetical protein
LTLVDWVANTASLGVGMTAPKSNSQTVEKRKPYTPTRPSSGKVKSERRLSIASAMAAFGGVEVETQASAARQLQSKGKWSVLLDGRARGPFPARKIAGYIKRGSIAADTRVAAPEWKDWKQVQDIAELQDMLLDTESSCHVAWLWYQCRKNTQLPLRDWDAISLLRTCAGLATEEGVSCAAGHEAMDRCRDWYERVDLAEDADIFAQHALSVLGRYPEWAVPADAPAYGGIETGEVSLLATEPEVPVTEPEVPVTEPEVPVTDVSVPAASLAETVVAEEAMVPEMTHALPAHETEPPVQIPQERSDPPTSLPPPIASIPQFNPKAYVHAKLDHAMQHVEHSMLLLELQEQVCALALGKGVHETEFREYLGTWLSIRRVKSEGAVAQDSINWIEKNRIAGTRWVKSTGVGNGTRVYIRAGLSESDAGLRIRLILENIDRWGCVLDDEKNANAIWQAQVTDFLSAKTKGKKYTKKQEGQMVVFLSELDIPDGENKLGRHLRKLGYELKSGWF